jgi:hypothetical protein
MGIFSRKPEGLQSPPAATPGADGLHQLQSKLSFYVLEYERIRKQAKSRRRAAVLTAAALNSVVTVLGAVIAQWHWTWIAVIGTGLSAAASLILFWDGFNKYHDLWIQRSETLSRLTRLQFQIEILLGVGEKRDSLAVKGLVELTRILTEGHEAWAQSRSESLMEKNGEELVSKTRSKLTD